MLYNPNLKEFQRGCGTRKAGKPYLCSSLSTFGLPINHFLIDPPVPVDNENWKRGTRFITDKSGINHLLIYVGKKFYPNPWDFIEEIKVFGCSRRIPITFDFSKLTPGKSRMFFAHARTVVLNKYLLDYSLPSDCNNPIKHIKDNTCIYDVKQLAFLHNDFSVNVYQAHDKVNLWDSCIAIEKPSFNYNCYTVPERIDQITLIQPPNNKTKNECLSYLAYLAEIKKDVKDKLIYDIPHFFMWLPITHIEGKQYLPPDVKEKINKAGYATHIMDY